MFVVPCWYRYSLTSRTQQNDMGFVALVGETCVLAALWGGWPRYQVAPAKTEGRRNFLRLLCCSHAGGREAVYNFRTVHSGNFSVPVAVNLVDLGKIRGVILRQLIQPGKLKMGAKKPPDLSIKRFLHPPRTCYWHCVASKEAVRGGPGGRLLNTQKGDCGSVHVGNGTIKRTECQDQISGEPRSCQAISMAA